MGDVERNEPSKLELFERFLRLGSTYVTVNERCFGVRVPRIGPRQEVSIFSFGYTMKIPIPDLAFDERGVSGTLNFTAKSAFRTGRSQVLRGGTSDERQAY